MKRKTLPRHNQPFDLKQLVVGPLGSLGEDFARFRAHGWGQRRISFKICVITIIGAILTGSLWAYAQQNTATTGEKAVATVCANGASAVDFDALAQCTATSGSGILQKAPLIVGQVTAPPYGTTDCDTAKAGMVQFTGTGFLGCNGTGWVELYGATTN